MGHAHSWEVLLSKRALVIAKMPDIVADFKRLLPYLPEIAGWDGHGDPVLGPNKVMFNGKHPNDYETFVFPGRLEEPSWREVPTGWSFSSCKTGLTREQRRPYDLAVLVFLLLAKAHLGDALRVTSDASIEDLRAAEALIRKVLGGTRK